jgi:hypothetical protein
VIVLLTVANDLDFEFRPLALAAESIGAVAWPRINNFLRLSNIVRGPMNELA